MSTNTKAWRIGLLGAGTVGGSFIKTVLQRAGWLADMGLGEASVERILVRDPNKARSLPVDDTVYTTDPEEVVDSANIDVVIELMGGVGQASGYVRRALMNGKHVITANKALIAAEGHELEALALEHDAALLYEASVGGGLPTIRPTRTHFAPNGITRMEAILNGTCNFILGELKEGQSFGDALTRAQEVGFAEADPSMDISGIDAAQKLAIMGTLAFGERHSEETVFARGIEQLDAPDVEYAAKNNLELILLASAEDSRPTGYHSLSVVPTFVDASSGLSKAEGPGNILSLATEMGGPFESMGLGAGGPATASAVFADLIAVLSGAWRGEAPGALAKAREITPAASHPYLKRQHAWYVRLDTESKTKEFEKSAAARGLHYTAVGEQSFEIAAADLNTLQDIMGDSFSSAAIIQYHPEVRPTGAE